MLRIYNASVYQQYIGMKNIGITQRIIERLIEASEASNSLFPKKFEHRHVMHMLLELDTRRKTTSATVSSILSRLRRQGLVERNGSTRSAAWRITHKGKKWHQERFQKDVLPKPDGITRLVIFDIPESERGKRTAIRTQLVGCNFRQLQKSVWIGTSPLGEDFVALLDELRLGKKVHIFSIREKGTIESI